MTQTIQTNVTPLTWEGDWRTGHVRMLDQRRLPAEELYHTYTTHREIVASIEDMVIRGAPAIGIAAAYGVFLGEREAVRGGEDPFAVMPDIAQTLAKTRPTAVNLFWALERMEQVAEAALEEDEDISHDVYLQRLWEEAGAICREDRTNNLAMGRFGAELLPQGACVLTHCNTGGLATGGYGTALGVIRAAYARGKLAQVFADETRPYLQGARLTTWELLRDDIPVTLITDSMAAHFMQRGEVDAVIVGTDRTVANGDVANKIGTYGLAVLCDHHDIPFYVCAPISTIDLDTPSGDQITIEERSAREVTHIGDAAIAPEDVEVRHPAFDVTPAELVSAIITERGIATAPYEVSLTALVGDSD